MMAEPVRDSPVNVTALIPGWLTRCSPVEPSPKPCTRLKTPFGTPASRITSASSVALPGVSSDGFTTTALPQASAGASFHVSSSSGRFHGVMIGDHADGLADGVIQRLLAVGSFGVEGFERRGLDEIGEGAEVRRSPRNVEPGSERDGFAGIRRLRLDEPIEARLDAVGDFVQQSSALPHATAAPFACQRAARSLNGFIDELGPGFRHARDERAIGGIDVVELSAAIDKAAVYKVPEQLGPGLCARAVCVLVSYDASVRCHCLSSNGRFTASACPKDHVDARRPAKGPVRRRRAKK